MRFFIQSVVYPNLRRLYHQIGRIFKLSADMNKLGARPCFKTKGGNKYEGPKIRN